LQHSQTDSKVWGVAYHIPAEFAKEVTQYLDLREINGYTIHYTEFQPADDKSTIRVLVYIGTPDNPQFVGPQDPEELANHILASKGLSGDNKEYLYELHVALQELCKDSKDTHVGDLARRVRELEAAQDAASDEKLDGATDSSAQ
jgi:cation transport protein ChaC